MVYSSFSSGLTGSFLYLWYKYYFLLETLPYVDFFFKQQTALLRSFSEFQNQYSNMRSLVAWGYEHVFDENQCSNVILSFPSKLPEPSAFISGEVKLSWACN
jgi:hypothetical protein